MSSYFLSFASLFHLPKAGDHSYLLGHDCCFKSRPGNPSALSPWDNELTSPPPLPGLCLVLISSNEMWRYKLTLFLVSIMWSYGQAPQLLCFSGLSTSCVHHYDDSLFLFYFFIFREPFSSRFIFICLHICHYIYIMAYVWGCLWKSGGNTGFPVPGDTGGWDPTDAVVGTWTQVL